MSFLAKLTEEVLPVYLTEVSNFENPSRVGGYKLSNSKPVQKAVEEFDKENGNLLSTSTSFQYDRRARREDFAGGMPILSRTEKIDRNKNSVMIAIPSGIKFIADEKNFVYLKSGHKTGNAHEYFVAAFMKFPTKSEYNPYDKNEKNIKKIIRATGIYDFLKNKKEEEKLVSAAKDTTQKVVNDARNIAERFHKNTLDAYNIDKIEWYGATSASKDSGSRKSDVADLIVHTKKGDEINVSLKYGEGQLKNLTAKTTVEIIKEQYDDIIQEIEEKKQFMDELVNIDSSKISNMLIEIIKYVLDHPEDLVAEMSDKLIEELRMVSSWRDFDYLGSQDKKTFSMNIGEKAEKHVKEKWKELREIYLFPVFKEFFEKQLNREQTVQREKLIKLYKKIFSIEKKEYVYISSTKYIQIPSENRFEEIIDAFEFTHRIEWVKSNPALILNVSLSGKQKDILSVDLNFRWTQGQLVGDLGAKASAVEFMNGLSDREVSDILNGNFD